MSEIMNQWDNWRKYIAEGGTASWPRDEFEMVIANYEEKIKELKNNLKQLYKKITCTCDGFNDNSCPVHLEINKAESRIKRLQEAVDEHKSAPPNVRLTMEHDVKLYKVRNEI